MKKGIKTLQRVLGIGLTWAIVWGAFWVTLGMIIRIVDPDSIDPGEPLGIVAVLGPMGLFTGVVFAILLSIGGRGRVRVDPSLTRVAGSGILATSIVQLPYLGHGDQGLAANIQMAVLFVAFGAVITIGWFLMARWWSRRHPSLPALEEKQTS